MALVVLVLSSIWAHRTWSPSPLGRPFRSGVWVGPSERHESYRQALAQVPADASLATNYFLVPHATHRQRIYEWPNPWIPGNWGIANRHPDDPATVDYLVLDLTLAQEPELEEELTNGPDAEFSIVSDEAGVVVAKRRATRSAR